MTASHWSDYHSRWSRLGPPLRPTKDVVEAMSRAIARHVGPTLLLGVTSELAGIAMDLTAVDRSPEMIRGLWPGDTEGRRATCANWLALPFANATFATAVGDGSLNALRYPEGYEQLFAELERVLVKGGRAVIRVFLRPQSPEPLADVCAAAQAGRFSSFHAFKWRFAMALAARAGDPNIAVRAIHEAFLAELPDRADLARRTGWEAPDIDTIDVYRDSSEVYTFPTADELFLAVPPRVQRTELRAAGTYELAERCPLLVLDL